MLGPDKRAQTYCAHLSTSAMNSLKRSFALYVSRVLPGGLVDSNLAASVTTISPNSSKSPFSKISRHSAIVLPFEKTSPCVRANNSSFDAIAASVRLGLTDITSNFEAGTCVTSLAVKYHQSADFVNLKKRKHLTRLGNRRFKKTMLSTYLKWPDILTLPRSFGGGNCKRPLRQDFAQSVSSHSPL